MTELKTIGAAIAAGTLVLMGSAAAAEYEAVTVTVNVDRSADKAWADIGGFCDISAWIKRTSACISGKGDLGSVRLINDRTVEVKVAETLYSYTYTPPNAPDLYHGTLAVQPNGPDKAIISYSVIYDQSSLPSADAKKAEHERRARNWLERLQVMKQIVESK